MTTSTINYASPATITADLSALASSTGWLAGRESNEVDNTTNKYIDALVHGSFTVGTTPATTGSMNVYVWGSDVSLATTALDVLDGTDSAETFASATAQGATVILASVTPVMVATSDTKYRIKPFAVAPLFGGIMPKFWGLFFSHNMTAALKTDAANTNSCSFQGIKYDLA